jgi:choloylglycine hydrolase
MKEDIESQLIRLTICLGILILFSQAEFSQTEKTNLLHGCTSFTLIVGSNLIFGRNLDVDSDIGNIFINPQGLNKTAYFDSASVEIPAKWTSKYGSITFNQISKDIPHGGMNTQGLVVEHLFLAESKYPEMDNRPALISHQWMQYMLDNCKNVSEVIESDSEVRISQSDFKFTIHFHVMDNTGDRAIIEFLDGKTNVFRNDTYLVGALANSTYENSLNSSEKFVGLGGNMALPTDVSSSIDRFVKAAGMVNNYPGNDIEPLIPYSFSILDSVRNNTQWQIVYDIKNLQIYYRTESLKTIRIIRLKDFEYSNTKSIKTISINDDPVIDDNWLLYTTDINRNIINEICNKSEFIKSVLGDEKEEIAVNPEK